MSNVFLLNINQSLVTFGANANVGVNFSSDNGYIYKKLDQVNSTTGTAFTKTLYFASLRLYQETDVGISYTNASQSSLRQSLGPKVPTAGPFIENYSVNGDLSTSSFINLLLIDKPPIRTGEFQFQIGTFTFSGTITKQTSYSQYNWQRVGGIYTYVESSTKLGYGIEINRSYLYDISVNNGNYTYTPTALLSFLNSLNGNEEITSTSTTSNPSSGGGVISTLSTISTLPVQLYYISPADALRYIASYPDLIVAYGTDYAKGQQDYANSAGERPITFDPIAYLNKYSDVRQQYGYDTYNATINYITTGYYQGRTADASTVNPLTGGLYDERYSSVILADDLIIWPQGETLAGSGSSLTYRYNTTSFFVNGSVPVTGNVTYLGVMV
jgi:hypothetical protein